MFYGLSPDSLPKFQESLKSITQIYGENAVFADDMLIALGKNLSYTWDENFVESFYNTAQNEQEYSLIWRLHVLIWAAEQGLRLEGDFVECGVFNGFMSAVICKYLEFQKLDKSFYLYDTFCGLPAEIASPDELKASGFYQQIDSAKIVRERFNIYPNVHIVQGVIPHSFAQAVPEKIAYLHIDLNSANAEILALEVLFPRMIPGALLVLDDFGWQAYQAQTIAEVKFMHDRGYKILELPTGQGLVIKR